MGSHHHHDHHHAHGSSQPSLLLPLLLIAGFAVVEAVGGWWTGSLALLSDAGHMVSDALALALAWLGSWIARKPATRKHNFGLGRAEVIVALVNALLMLAVIAGIVYEAVQRLADPQPVQGGEVMLIAFIGMLINIVVAWMLHKGHSSLNSRAALLHVLGDLLGSVAAIIAGAVIYFTGWMPIDPLLSIFISVLILLSTLRLLGEVLHVLMEGVPRHLDIQAVEQALASTDKVREVHHLHIWSLSSERIALSAHVVLEDMQDWHPVLSKLRHMLHDRFNIEHVTLQPETVTALSNGSANCWLTQKTEHAHDHDHDHVHGHAH
ncbi:cation diffusion facilitator family transporter [Methylobacillus arboreus]|uniref:cation diffusion facilitator family transporter n=1 Tax=Methylobacillus arboreus TaxID=755170 RepID=UPI001E46579C|nr:cation diffusion facilitator family transporter [Methylobacillus arboreus]MCB5189461.1 cation diffusion facilitator family transporter [Methylobacillus arboreus]